MQTVKPRSEGSSAYCYCAQLPLASQQHTPEWGGHAYLCQHVLLIIRKTTKYTAIITKEQQKVFRLFEEGFLTDSLNFIQKSQVRGKCRFQILLYSFIMSALWLYTREEGVFDSEDARRKACLPLTICWSDAKAGDFLNRQEQNCSEQQLGNRNFFIENPAHTADT